MKREDMIENTRELVEPIVSELGYEFYHMEYVREDNENYLRIYIDSPNRISLEDCEKVSRPVSDMLDVKDPIPDSYYLEVSSPGINRGLYTDKHFEKYKGRQILIKLSSSFEGKKALVGTLVNYNDEEIFVIADDKELQVPRKKIKSVNLEGEL
jgi:ribosome maturation factor RimP